MWQVLRSLKQSALSNCHSSCKSCIGKGKRKPDKLLERIWPWLRETQEPEESKRLTECVLIALGSSLVWLLQGRMSQETCCSPLSSSAHHKSQLAEGILLQLASLRNLKHGCTD